MEGLKVGSVDHLGSTTTFKMLWMVLSGDYTQRHPRCADIRRKTLRPCQRPIHVHIYQYLHAHERYTFRRTNGVYICM